jgi:hypothetical protein
MVFGGGVGLYSIATVANGFANIGAEPLPVEGRTFLPALGALTAPVADCWKEPGGTRPPAACTASVRAV